MEATSTYWKPVFYLLEAEASAFRWAAPAEVPGLTTEVFAYRILDAYRDDPVPAVREHNGVNLSVRLFHGLNPAPKTYDVGEQPLPIFTPNRASPQGHQRTIS